MLLSLSISYLFYQDEKKHQEELHKSEEKYIIGQHEDGIHKLFLNITTDLKILAESYPKCSDQKEQKDALNNFTEILHLFSQHRRVYDQVRLVNKDGMEQIRVNRIAEQSVIVPKKDLQYKGKRYYFQDTIKLNHGEVFISPFDLNVEHGAVEKPYKPMLRFGTPIFDQKGNKQGVVLLNYLGQEILDQLAEYTADRLHGKLMLLNREGYWLYGERQNDAWAFMWSERAGRTFDASYPEAWKNISSEYSGQFVTNENLFTFITLYPLSDGMTSSTGNPNAFGESEEEIKTGEYYWKLLTRLPLEQIEQEHLMPARYSLLLFNLVLFILLGPISWLLISFYASRETTRLELNRFKNVLDKTLDSVFMFDPETLRFTYVNQGGQNQVGYSADEFMKMTPVSIKPDFTEAKFREMIAELTKGKTKNLFFQTVHQHKNGTKIPVEIHLQYIEPDHSTACFVAVIRDITERKQAEEALEAARQRLLTVLDSIDAMVYVIDLESYKLLFLNKYALDIFGDITGAICWKSLQIGLDGPCDCCPNDLLCDSGECSGESYVWERQNPFNERWYELHDRVIKWFDGRDVKIQIATDITERRRMERQLHHNAYHDCLTKLANRLLFYERFEQELIAAKQSSAKMALIFIDLNKFKPVNDQYGHDTGDLLLQEVARRLLSSVRQADMVARMGGDEFVLLLPGMQSNDDLLRIVDKINAALGAPCQLSPDININISAATGTAVYPDDGMLADELLNTADERMYRNKRQEES
jgi:diguanylate cyclase (GGDEF)-like protein/PAS domain S-box-containing protein